MDRYMGMPPEVRAQWWYCKANDLPMFLPTDGRCDNCCSNVFGKGGYTMLEAKGRLLTCCPYCKKSWTD